MISSQRLIISILNELQKQRNEINELRQEIIKIKTNQETKEKEPSIEGMEKNLIQPSSFIFPEKVYEQLYISSSSTSEASSVIDNTDYQKDIIDNK